MESNNRQLSQVQKFFTSPYVRISLHFRIGAQNMNNGRDYGF